MKHSRLLWPAGLAMLLGILWLGVFPLWQDLSYAHITRAKWLGALTLGYSGAAAALAAVIVLLCRRQLRQVFRPSAAQLAALLYFCWVALSAWQGRLAGTLNSKGSAAVLWGAIRHEGLVTQLCYGAVFFTMSLFPVRMKPLLFACAAALTVYCAVVALQYGGGNPLGLYPAGRSIFTNYEFQGTIGNIDMVSGYLCLAVPLLLASFVLSPRGGWFLLLAASLGALLEFCMGVQSGLIAMGVLAVLLSALMLCQPQLRFRGMLALCCMTLCLSLRRFLRLPWLDGGAAVALAFSPSGLLLLLAAGLMLLAAFLLRYRPGRGLSGKALLCLALTLCLTGALLITVLPIPPSAAGLWELHETLLGRGEDAFGSWRLGAWRHTLHMSTESPVFGTGPDTFFYALRAHLTQEGCSLGENFDNPHNEYLAILSNNGSPALLFYLALLILILLRCAKAGREDRFSWALGCAVLCYAVQGFFSFSICLVAPMFWAVLGMGAAPAPRSRGVPPLDNP